MGFGGRIYQFDVVWKHKVRVIKPNGYETEVGTVRKQYGIWKNGLDVCMYVGNT